ncbi:16.9 kDa class I heat shock protein 3-like [Phragmites australis]|uniref:16.9 kDa class I heat shock protein 3-like n=1 Tax=Phragmites australis TaxID=29695 RepID=UPI002D77C9D5|nr:16.9 kDa class I heat shock protein 3-like [Phragmites australis]
MLFVRRGNVFDPFADFWDPFEGVFRSLVPSVASSDRDTAAFATACIDWKETPEERIFKAELPDVKKEEVKVQVEDGNVLVISGEPRKVEDDKWRRVERSSGQFMRRFRLPENAKVDQMKAGLENGVLTVTVSKAEVKKPEAKAIEISGLLAKSSSRSMSCARVVLGPCVSSAIVSHVSAMSWSMWCLSVRPDAHY